MKNLIVVFSDGKEFDKAVKFFENKSLFTPDGYDEKEGSIGFDCDCWDADNLEREINKELLHYGFFSYYFIFE